MLHAMEITTMEMKDSEMRSRIFCMILFLGINSLSFILLHNGTPNTQIPKTAAYDS